MLRALETEVLASKGMSFCGREGACSPPSSARLKTHWVFKSALPTADGSNQRFEARHRAMPERKALNREIHSRRARKQAETVRKDTVFARGSPCGALRDATAAGVEERQATSAGRGASSY